MKNYDLHTPPSYINSFPFLLYGADIIIKKNISFMVLSILLNTHTQRAIPDFEHANKGNLELL